MSEPRRTKIVRVRAKPVGPVTAETLRGLKMLEYFDCEPGRPITDVRVRQPDELDERGDVRQEARVAELAKQPVEDDRREMVALRNAQLPEYDRWTRDRIKTFLAQRRGVIESWRALRRWPKTVLEDVEAVDKECGVDVPKWRFTVKVVIKQSKRLTTKG